jgi:hypothetical protein
MIAKRQRREKARHHRRKQERNKKAMTAVNSDGKETSVHQPSYPVLGMTIHSVLPEPTNKMFPKLQAQLESGSLTGLVILVPFYLASRHARKHIKEILDKRGAPWVWDYLVFQWPHESFREFVLRVADSYDITHFCDVDREPLMIVATSPSHHQKLCAFKPHEEDGWLRIEAWLAKTCPGFIPTFERAEEANTILGAAPA